MYTLGYGENISPNGFCFGLGFMALHAISKKEVDKFNQRFRLFDSIPVEAFKATVEAAERKKKKIYNEKRKAYLKNQFLLANPTLNENTLVEALSHIDKTRQEIELSEPRLDDGMKQLIETLKKPDNISIEIRRQLDAEAEAALSEDEQLLANAEAFFNGVALYQEPTYFSEIRKAAIDFAMEETEKKMAGETPENIEYAKKKLLKKTQNEHVFIPFLAPTEIAPKNQLQQVDVFSSVYGRNDLLEYIENFEFEAKGCDQPIYFGLLNSNHFISISYDPSLRQWSLFDANYAPIVQTDDSRVAADHIYRAFKQNDGRVYMATKVFCATDNTQEVAKVVTNWKQTCEHHFELPQPALEQKLRAEFEKISRPTTNASSVNLAEKSYLEAKINEVTEINKELKARLDYKDDTDYRWLNIAVFSDDTKSVKELLVAGANPNFQVKKTPLIEAVGRNNLEMAKVLLSYNANPNAMSLGLSPLNIAFINRNLAMLELLIGFEAKVDLNDIVSRSPQKDPSIDPHYNAAVELLSKAAQLQLECQKYLMASIKDTPCANERSQARSICFDAIKAMRSLEGKEKLLADFKKLDNAAFKFIKILQTYHPNNKNREEALKQLTASINSAYAKFTLGKTEVDEIIRSLNMEAKVIGLGAEEDHAKNRTLPFFTKSTLGKHIKQALETEVKEHDTPTPKA